MSARLCACADGGPGVSNTNTDTAQMQPRDTPGTQTGLLKVVVFLWGRATSATTIASAPALFAPTS